MIYELTYSNFIIFFFLNLLWISSIFTLLQKNPIHSILFLILTFVSFVFFLLYLGVEFISLLFLIVYVGAISILFLFVIMMLNIRYIILDKKNTLMFSGFFLVLISIIVEIFFFSFFQSNLINFYIVEYSYFNWINTFLYKTDIESIGFTLFNFFYLEFCLSGIILFVAMVGSISLVISSNQVAKSQSPDFQIKKSSSLKEVFYLKK